jgi:hypothetical protein
MVEHDDQVRLDERRCRHADRIPLRERHGCLEGGHRVVRQRADGAAGEARHPVDRLDPAAGDEAADRVERIRRVLDVGRKVRRVVADGHRPGLQPGDAVANLQQAARPDTEERVAPQSLAALDGFEQVGRRGAVVEAQEGADRRLEVRRPRGAQEHRVRVGGEALRLGQAERIGCGHRRLRLVCRGALVGRRIRNDLRLSGRKVVPSAVPPSFGDAALS